MENNNPDNRTGEYRTGFATQEGTDTTRVDFDERDLKETIKRMAAEVAELKEFKKRIEVDGILNNVDFKIDTGRKFITGPALLSGNTFDTATSAVISTGKDKTSNDGVENTQLTVVRADSGTSVVYALGGNVITGNDAIFKAGNPTIRSEKFTTVPENSLVGQYITVQFDSGVLVSLPIISNVDNTLTVSSSPTQSSTSSNFVVYRPVFLGGEEYPWQRLYVHGGIPGGIQFGGGSNNNGGNGLLYITGQDIRYRSPNGTDIKLN